MLTFADLSTPEAIATIRARLVAGLVADGFPADPTSGSWAPSSSGGVENLRLDFTAGGIGSFLPPRIAAFVNGRILPLATDDPTTGNYLTALGKKFYGLDKRGATSTIQNVALYVPPGVSVSYTFAPGDLWVKSSSTGNRYRSITGGSFSGANTWPNYPTIVPGVDNPLMLQFQAENPGKVYSDAAGTIATMVTARAGVRCLNIAPSDYMPNPASCDGTSTGTVRAARVPPIDSPGSIRVQTLKGGDVGTATFRYTFDGGVNWSGSVVTAPSLRLSSMGGATAQVSFANNSSGGATPSFVIGDTFTMFLGNAILQQGNDAETDAAFRRRCANRWPALSPIPVAGTVDLWAHDASQEVDKVSVDADPSTSGAMIVTIASATGPASPAAQVAVQDYITARLWGYRDVPAPATAGFTSPQETVSVISAIAQPVTAAGVVRVPKAQLAQAQVIANVNWIAYLADLPLGGQPGAVVELAKLAQILADAGAIDIPGLYTTLTLNGVAADFVVPAGSVAVPPANSSLLTSITWQPA